MTWLYGIPVDVSFSFFMVMMQWIQLKWKGPKDFLWILRDCTWKLRYLFAWKSKCVANLTRSLWKFSYLTTIIQATCPAGRTEKLSPSEISEFINSRLSKDEVTSCNFGYEAFKKKLLEFFGKRRCHVSIKQLQV